MAKTTNKLKHIELSDGWSFVTRLKGGRRKKNTQSPNVPSDQTAEADDEQVARIIADVEQICGALNQSDCARALRSVLAKVEGNLETALCAGLGSLDDSSTLDVRRSKHQLAFFLWLKDVAGKADCKLWARDPVFSATDKAVLEHFKANVDLWKQCQDAQNIEPSILFAPYLPWPILTLELLSRTKPEPSVIVCQSLRAAKEVFELERVKLGNDLSSSTTEVDGRVCSREDYDNAAATCDRIMNQYHATDFPEYDALPDAFALSVVYVKKTAGTKTEGT